MQMSISNKGRLLINTPFSFKMQTRSNLVSSKSDSLISSQNSLSLKLKRKITQEQLELRLLSSLLLPGNSLMVSKWIRNSGSIQMVLKWLQELKQDHWEKVQTSHLCPRQLLSEMLPVLDKQPFSTIDRNWLLLIIKIPLSNLFIWQHLDKEWLPNTGYRSLTDSRDRANRETNKFSCKLTHFNISLLSMLRIPNLLCILWQRLKMIKLRSYQNKT